MLAKGFLRPQKVIYKYSLGTGIALGLISSFGFYGFFYFIRESIRISSSQFGGYFITLSPKENFYYNLFYASIASILGLYITLKFVFENSIVYQDRKLKLRQRHILNEIGFNSWTFLYAFGKISFLLGICFLTFYLIYDISFIDEYPYLLILIPTVLFLNTWPAITRTLGNQGFRGMSYVFLSLAIVSFGYAHVNLFDSEKVNKQIQSNTVDLAFYIKLPETDTFHRTFRSSLSIDIYMLRDSISVLPKIFVKDANTIVKTEDLLHYVNVERAQISEYERDQVILNLLIDERLELKYVNEIKQDLRRGNLRTIQYSTGIKNSKYPPNHPLFKNVGLRHILFPYYPQLDAFLDSAEHLDPEKYAVKIPDNPMYRVVDVKNYNRVEIKVDSTDVLLNGKSIEKEKLETFIEKFIEKYAPDYVIIFAPEETISYGRYIEYLDLIQTIIGRMRNRLYMRKFNRFFDDEYIKDQDYYSVIQQYPLYVVEWTNEEKRLIRLMEKEKASRNKSF